MTKKSNPRFRGVLPIYRLVAALPFVGGPCRCRGALDVRGGVPSRALRLGPAKVGEGGGGRLGTGGSAAEDTRHGPLTNGWAEA